VTRAGPVDAGPSRGTRERLTRTGDRTGIIAGCPVSNRMPYVHVVARYIYAEGRWSHERVETGL
jgi:hypothetical protein